jgi:hypothetical protein
VGRTESPTWRSSECGSAASLSFGLPLNLVKRVVRTLLSVALLGALSGCSRSHPPSIAQEPDRLVVTNRYGSALSVTVTGAEVARIANAVASLTEDQTAYPDIKDCQIQFYRGSDLLRLIYVQD